MKKLILIFISFTAIFCISQNSQAYQSFITRAQDGRELFNFYVAGENETYYFGENKSIATLNPEHLNLFQYTSEYWSSLLGNSLKNSKAVKVAVGTVSKGCASRGFFWDVGKTTLARAIFNDDTSKPLKDGSFGILDIEKTNCEDSPFGKFYYAEPIKLLPNHKESLLSATLVHEMGHLMGINSSGSPSLGFYGDNLYDERLFDSFGNPSGRSMKIVQSNSKVPGKFAIIPKSPEVLDDVYGGGYAFFQGKNVNEVINPQNLPDAYFPFNNPYRVHGIPINGFENPGEGNPDAPEFSHIELRNSMMSHQNYRNWTTFMEAELAVFQDIGIPIDRRNLYGYSIYTSNGTHDVGKDHSFYARTCVDKSSKIYRYDIGKFNKTPLTIGFHVYGSSNTINMSQEILTEGRASAGVRIDGVKNDLTITEKSNICANGEDGIGVLVSYGKDHTITHKGTITATGKNGIGIRCDFGHNYIGDFMEYRGSYIFNKYCHENLPLLDELNGPLVTDLSISGNIKAKYAAIYISENAFVKNIQICDKAQIEGDIISVRNGTSIAEQGSDHERKYCPVSMQHIQYANKDELNTRLVFGDSPNSKIIYNGNIVANGAMDVLVSKGELYYHGRMSGIRQFCAEPNAMFFVNALSNGDIASIQAQEIKFKAGASIATKYDKRPFSYKLEETVLELISGNIDIDKDVITCVSNGNNENNEFTVGFYTCPFTSGCLKWAKTKDGFNLNFVLENNASLSISSELTAAKASGAPLVMAACDNISANAIFNRADELTSKKADELTSKRKKIGVWCSPDVTFNAKDKGGLKCSVNSKAIVFGIDRKTEEQNWLLGAGGEVAYPKYKSNDTNIETECFSGFAYGAINLLEEVNLNAFIKYGKNDYSQNRNIREEKYHNKYKGNQCDVGLKIDYPLEIDYPLKIGKAVEFKPFASYECIILGIDGYEEQKLDEKENGKGTYALDFDKGESRTHRVNVGAKLDFNITKVINLDASLFYSGLYGDTNSNILVKYSQAKDVSARSRGGELDKHSIGACINFKVQSTSRSNIILGYGVTRGKNYLNNHLRASFSLKF